MNRPNVARLDALLAPSSVAVIGASEDPNRIGGRPVSYLLEAGFPGRIFPVNPNRASVQGLKAYPSILDVPEPPDVCLVAVKASLVPDVLEDCAIRGSKSSVVFSAGFAEAGEDGRKAQGRLTELAGRTGMRTVGPNCLGVFNARARWMGTFASPIRQSLPTPGPISIASQSGAVGSELFSLLRRGGLETGVWVTTGNEADVDVADAISYLAADLDTRIIVAYAEGIRNGPSLRVALEEAAGAGKPVVFMKTGRSKAGAAAARSHTAALAGSDRIYRVLFRHLGVIQVGTFEELVDAVYLLTFGARPIGKRLAIVTISGGVGVQMADAASDLGLEVPELSADAQRDLRALIPFASARNPVDVTAQVFNDLSLVSRYLRTMLEDRDFDAVVLFLTTVVAEEETSRGLVAELGAVMTDFGDVALIISLLAPRAIGEIYEAAGYPVFQDPTRAIRAASVLARLTEAREGAGAKPPVEVPAGAARLSDRTIAGGEPGPALLGEYESMRLLESWGFPCVERCVARSVEEALEAGERLGGRLALKMMAKIKHKTDVGGVLLGVHGEAGIREGFQMLMERQASLDPDGVEAGVLVEPMAPEGVDAVAGVSRDATFGPVVMVGLGGVLVEVLDDVAFRLAPFGVTEAHRMIGDLKGAALFRGFRGRPEADLDALAELLSRLSVFAVAEEGAYSGVDLNPVRVLPRGLGVLVLDALIDLPAQSSEAS